MMYIRRLSRVLSYVFYFIYFYTILLLRLFLFLVIFVVVIGYLFIIVVVCYGVLFALRFCSVVVDGRAANAYFINETLLRISLDCECMCAENDGADACAHSLNNCVYACVVPQRVFVVNGCALAAISRSV